jgi:hypothetical protein
LGEAPSWFVEEGNLFCAQVARSLAPNGRRRAVALAALLLRKTESMFHSLHERIRFYNPVKPQGQVAAAHHCASALVVLERQKKAFIKPSQIAARISAFPFLP